jgi:hypothetical protein
MVRSRERLLWDSASMFLWYVSVLICFWLHLSSSNLRVGTFSSDVSRRHRLFSWAAVHLQGDGAFSTRVRYLQVRFWSTIQSSRTNFQALSDFLHRWWLSRRQRSTRITESVGGISSDRVLPFGYELIPLVLLLLCWCVGLGIKPDPGNAYYSKLVRMTDACGGNRMLL